MQKSNIENNNRKTTTPQGKRICVTPLHTTAAPLSFWLRSMTGGTTHSMFYQKCNLLFAKYKF
jgi:hypothetical protein